jgi:ribonuclease VapC
VVIDASAMVAILLAEPEAAAFAKAIANDSKRLASVLSVLEAAIVMEVKKGPAGPRELDLLLHSARIDVIAMNVQQLQLAREAWHRFGKGHHPAGLNLGDCCAYALARYSGEPLLFKGTDFPHTDLRVVTY